MPGKLVVIATPLGHLDDLSPRALDALKNADCIACEDTRRTSGLLARFGIATPLVSCHKFNERARLQPLLDRLAEGLTVALVSDAGTPGVADPGALLVRAALDAGHAVSPVPGPSAVTALLSVSGLPADRFRFEGFLPSRAGERRRVLRGLSTLDVPLVLYEAPHRIRESLEDIRSVLGERPLVLGRELTKLHETILHGSAGEILEALGPTPKGEIVLAIAPGGGHESSDADAEETRAVWREELAAGGGDRRTALRRTAGRMGMKRAALYRLLAELGENP
ncbi:MAG: 16S rRNA (cytidine(1402)-2'-O)-methyltransferase [Acidobacteria bacterium]|nr:16S rRNA (cytidine(1402)-2'-O)-methyltransferase [Acidobacteriota bacterium]NIM63749.1 16S rRNA (cytidine(1402)-2'-O)-methyltransferase [Acidobacteriota bacterium]NIO59318.1 16S rRNA (cytidine(1402)-2'-O)-methyltransferase [Acidobacteriota bacterium]NIQ30332.1 16S rRNA (cytidine(1402)-2'-O)-methyltransferase [Acidobacteriota bacterium]NIQ85269.1 16S rRNA (cytidine(1402)-2'-O)-methyltransferase [Acidobacteriota bacterium]